MAKIILLLTLLCVFSCATGPKTEMDLPQNLKENLFGTQASFELYNSFNDPLFVSLKNRDCLADWEKKVFDLNKQLRVVKTNKERLTLWYDLGNCYNYTGEFNKSLYYYDLILSFDKKNSRLNSTVMANIGLIYKVKGLDVLSRSYLQNSIDNNPTNCLASYLLSLDYLNQGDFTKANDYLARVIKQVPKSRLARSTMGVSYVLSDNKFELNNKVLKFMNEKDEEAVLFKIALKLYDGEVNSDRLSDLKDLELKFPVLDSFRDYLLTKFGKE